MDEMTIDTSWGTEFDISMLFKSDIYIHCPEKQLSDELLQLLEEHGVRWSNGELPTFNSDMYWEDFKEETCYHVYFDKTLKYDGKSHYSSIDDGIKCTFYGSKGKENTDFEPADDQSLFSFLGVK